MNIESMTAAQQEAALTTEKHTLCIAGPGSGKTAVLVARIQHLTSVAFVPPGRIVAITFTNAAARELESRLAAVGVKGLGYCGTLHGFALRMLRAHGAHLGYGARLSIISPESALELLNAKAAALGCKLKEDELLKLKAKGRPARGQPLDVPETVVATYYDELAEAGVLDFDLILSEFAKLLFIGGEFEKLSHLFVDEVQDSSEQDWTIYRRLPMEWKFFVGDPDQAIFGFRGGAVQQMLDYGREPGVSLLFLRENFRSHSQICDAANRLIDHNPGRFVKNTESMKGPGGCIFEMPECSNEGEEISYVLRVIKTLSTPSIVVPHQPVQSIAVLARTNALCVPFVQVMQAAGIPVVTREKSDLPKDWAYARSLVELLANPSNNLAALFFIRARELARGQSFTDAAMTAKRAQQQAAKEMRSVNDCVLGFRGPFTAAMVLGVLGMQKVTVETRMMLAQIAVEVGPEAPALDLALAMAGTRDDVHQVGPTAGVQVLTVHAAKGREFDVVFMAGMEQGTFPPARKDTDLAEERRLAFVAITRARKFLYVSHVRSRVTAWKQVVAFQPSQFIREALI